MAFVVGGRRRAHEFGHMVSMNHFAHVFECIHVRLSFCSSKAKNKCFVLIMSHGITQLTWEIPTPKGAALFRSCNFLVANKGIWLKKNSIILCVGHSKFLSSLDRRYYLYPDNLYIHKIEAEKVLSSLSPARVLVLGG